jgi:hypothetical protein
MVAHSNMSPFVDLPGSPAGQIFFAFTGRHSVSAARQRTRSGDTLQVIVSITFSSCRFIHAGLWMSVNSSVTTEI